MHVQHAKVRDKVFFLEQSSDDSLLDKDDSTVPSPSMCRYGRPVCMYCMHAYLLPVCLGLTPCGERVQARFFRILPRRFSHTSSTLCHAHLKPPGGLISPVPSVVHFRNNSALSAQQSQNDIWALLPQCYVLASFKFKSSKFSTTFLLLDFHPKASFCQRSCGTSLEEWHGIMCMLMVL
jgi:hypothetical protein